MARWDGYKPKKKMSPARLAFFREANRRSRTIKRGRGPRDRFEVMRIARAALRIEREKAAKKEAEKVERKAKPARADSDRKKKPESFAATNS